MKYYLEKIMNNGSFTEKEAHKFIYTIEAEEINEAALGAILTGIQFRGVQLDELNGFRLALLELCNPIHLDVENSIDVCGTGGDGKDTFNISTTSAIVLAAMGIKVIKHGNYGVSSVCGSSNVLESIGIKFHCDSIKLQKDLDNANICFIHAPLFHPTLKKVAKIREDLGIRTFFNALGPLVNPVQPPYQLTGTYSFELAKIYAHILKNERKDYRVVHGLDGYDEITLTDSTRILGKKTDYVLNAANYGVNKVNAIHLKSGRSIESSARILLDILRGEGSSIQNHVIAANVSTALSLYHPSANQLDLFNEALAFIKSGQSFKSLTHRL